VGRDLSNLAPANGTNAIVSAAFAIELDSADPSLVSGFNALAPLMTIDGFEPPAPQVMFTVAIGGISGGSQEVNGYTYLRKNTAGQPVRDFSLRGNSISIVVYEYTRWHLIWPEVQKLFDRCAPLVATSTRTVNAIAMQYIDKFTWRESDTPFPSKDVLRHGSKQFAPLALDFTGPWHNQFGCQRGLPSEHWASHRIENVNLSVSVEGGYTTLTIFTIYRYFARNAVRAAQDFVNSVLSKTFAQAHDDNKQLLREILNDEVCNLIKLND